MRTPAPTVLERFGTGLLSTEVFLNADGGCTWTRTAGPLAPTPFVMPSGELWQALQAAAAAPSGQVALALPDSVSEVRRYRAPGPVSVAAALLDGVLADPHRAAPLTGMIRDLGRLLRTLHTVPVPQTGIEPGVTRSRGLRRLGDWLEGRATSSLGLHSAVRLRELLGEDRWQVLGAWHRALLGDGQRVLSHGAAGLGSTAGDASFTAAVLLTGEDVAILPWYVDLGWVLGEITELGACYGGTDPAAWSRLSEALFEGYGRAPGAECNAAAILRITLHLHDFLCYFAWSEAETIRYASLLTVLVDAGAGECFG